MLSSLYLILVCNFAVIPNGSVELFDLERYEYDFMSDCEDYKVGFNIELAIFNALFVGGGADIYVNPKSFLNYHPKIIDSFAYIKIDLKWLNIRYSHRCTHPILTWKVEADLKRYYEAAYDELSIEFVGKIDMLDFIDKTINIKEE